MAAGLIEQGEYKRLESRKLTKATCEAYGYSIGEYKGQTVQIAPYYRKGKLVAQHLRGKDKAFAWTGTAQGVELFGQRLYPANSHRRLVITEGEIDAMSIAQVFNLKQPVVSIPSGASSADKAIQDNLEYISSFDEVVFAFDNDGAGQEALEKCVHLIAPGRARLMVYPEGYKDANDMLKVGMGQLVVEGVLKATRWQPDGIVSGADLWKDFITEVPPGYDILYPLMSDMYKGLRKGELHIWTAGSGLGKSTAVHEIGYDLMMRHKLSLGVISLEESPRRTAERYVGIHLNRPLHVSRGGLTLEELESAFAQTVGNGRFWCLKHFGSYDVDRLLSRFRYLAVACNVDFILLDHISIVISGLDEIGDNERRMLDLFMTKTRSLVEETGVGFQAIVHLKRPKDGKSYNEGRSVSLSDLRGSAALEQLSDGVTSIEGNQQGEHPDDREIRVLKNRLIGKVGKADSLHYDHDSGRLLAQGFDPVADCPF